MDRHHVPVSAYVGPGDAPNIGISLLLMHRLTGNVQYLVAAAKAVRYSLSMQAVPGEDYPYAEDPLTQWGFWSWDPPYDYTMSPDHSTHHVRGLWFFLDYWAVLSEETRGQVGEALAHPGAEEGG